MPSLNTPEAAVRRQLLFELRQIFFDFFSFHLVKDLADGQENVYSQRDSVLQTLLLTLTGLLGYMDDNTPILEVANSTQAGEKITEYLKNYSGEAVPRIEEDRIPVRELTAKEKEQIVQQVVDLFTKFHSNSLEVTIGSWEDLINDLSIL